MTVVKRKNPFDKCRKHAVLIARTKGMGVGACPYKNPPYSTVWIKAYSRACQADFLLANKGKTSC